jgi:hypothetical protein
LKDVSVSSKVGGAAPKPRFVEAVRFELLPIFFFAASAILEQVLFGFGVSTMLVRSHVEGLGATTTNALHDTESIKRRIVKALLLILFRINEGDSVMLDGRTLSSPVLLLIAFDEELGRGAEATSDATARQPRRGDVTSLVT